MAWPSSPRPSASHWAPSRPGGKGPTSIHRRTPSKAIPTTASIVQIRSTGWLTVVSPSSLGPAPRLASGSPDAMRSAPALICDQASWVTFIDPPSLPSRSRPGLRDYGDRDGHRVAQGKIAATLRMGVDLQPVVTGRYGHGKRDLRFTTLPTVSGRDNLRS